MCLSISLQSQYSATHHVKNKQNFLYNKIINSSLLSDQKSQQGSDKQSQTLKKIAKEQLEMSLNPQNESFQKETISLKILQKAVYAQDPFKKKKKEIINNCNKSQKENISNCLIIENQLNQKSVIKGKIVKNLKREPNYIGQYVQNKKNGFGIFVQQDFIYMGQWKNDKKDGYGAYFYSNGTTFIGKWKQNKKYDKGTFFYCGGSQYQVQWKQDKRHGKATFTFPNGIIEVQNWQNDKRII